MKILLLDIETAPNIAYVWGLFKENIPLARLVDAGYVLTWAAKWYGTDEILNGSIQEGEKNMLKRIHALLDEADVVIHYNGKKFDIPTLNKEFVKNGMLPPSPYRQIDLYHIVRATFRFPSNKLDYVAQALKVGKKVEHAGFELWIRCMNGEQAAFDEMRVYNTGDVILLEGVYEKVKPWIRNHPNVAVLNQRAHSCPNCGGSNLERRGFAHTNAAVYQRYRCNGCGAWSRTRKNEGIKGALAGIQ